MANKISTANTKGRRNRSTHAKSSPCPRGWPVAALDSGSLVALPCPALTGLMRGLRLTTALCSVVVVLPTLATGTAWALPQGGTVTSGQAQIIVKAKEIDVIQSTASVVINWNTFNIAAGESIVFSQLNSSWSALNRVIGGGASVINGSISALGTVAISNAAGINIGVAGKVNVGSFIATTANIRDNDFTAGKYNFAIAGNPTSSVINQGTVTVADGGLAAFVAPGVQNAGVINARLGKVALASGHTFTVDLYGDRLINYAVDSKVLQAATGADGQKLAAAAENTGRINAAGGVVQITANVARGIVNNVINTSGVIQAQSVSVSQSGEIVLDGGSTGTVQVTGTLDVSGRGAGQTGGRVSVTGQEVKLASTARIDARGSSGGGTVAVGGGWQGGGKLAHATAVQIDPGAQILAGALDKGVGGMISVWSDGTTKVWGTLDASGGAQGGDGGNIETSGHELDVTGITVNAAGLFGSAGTWLLDPYSLTVSGGATTATQSPAATWTANAGGSTVLNTTINAALNAGTSVVLQTSGSLGDGQGLGDITVSAAIDKTAGAAASLTLKAAGSISVGAAITSTSGALNVTLNSNTLGGGGYVGISAPITTLGGNLVVGGGANPLTGAAVGTSAQSFGVSSSGALSTGGGSITINGTGFNSSTGSNYGVYQPVGMSSGDGNITLTGTGGGTNSVAIGYYSQANITAAGGNVLITGATAAGAGSASYGVQISTGSNVSTTGNGTITLAGTVTGSGATGSGIGVFLLAGGNLTAANGLISVTGHNNSTGTGGVNVGVAINSAGSFIKSTGTGGMTIVGTGGGAGAGDSNSGVNWDAPNALQSTGTGAITVTGTGGDAGGSGMYNFGVYFSSAVTASGGTISITGIGGNSSGLYSYGIDQNGGTITNTGTGGITLSGTGGGTGAVSVGTALTASITTGTGNIAISGTASANATTSANHGVAILAGTTSTAGTGTITINGTATGNGAGSISWGVVVAGGAVVSTVDGLLKATGTSVSTGTGGGNDGIYITGAGSTIKSSGSGGVTLIGTAGGSAAGANNYGVVWDVANAIQSTGTGAINITGTGGDAGGSGSGNLGVYAAASLAGSGGAISITGTGGNASGSTNYGISQTAAISNTGAGSITLLGTGGGSGTPEYGYGSTADVTAVTGNISITGISSAGATGAGSNGVNISGATVSTGGAGTITIDGTATGNGAGGNTYGTMLNGTFTTANGLLKVKGRNNSTGTGTNNFGVVLAGTLNSTGTGGVQITGFGGGSGASGSDYGVHWNTANVIQATGGGAITIAGTGGDTNGSGGSNNGVYFTGALAGSGGAISITGTGGNSSGSGNYGINQGAAVSNTGTGSISLTGAGGGTGSSEYGVGITSAVTAGTGNISVIGAGSAGATGSTSNGIQVNAATISTTGIGTITLNGTATGDGTGAGSTGVLVNGGAIVTAVDGLIGVTGISSSTGSGTANSGIYVSTAGSTIKSTGTGGVTLAGTGGGAGAGGTDYGVVWDFANAIQSTGGGAIGITGTGGDVGGTGVNNYGIYAGSAVAGSGGALSMTGIGGASSGTNNSGIALAGAVSNTGSGTITLVGTGGGAGSNQYGIYTNSNVTAATGAISMTGASGTLATGSSNYGVDIAGGTTSTGGSGTVTIDGTARGTGAGANSFGVYINSGSVVTAAGGLLSVTGRSNSTGTGGGNDGIHIVGANSTLKSTGIGGVAATGFGGGSGAASGDYGVYSSVANGIQSTSTGAIAITGTGGDTGGSGSANIGILATAAITGNGGAITMTGTASNSSGGGNLGISLASVADGAGTLTLTSTAGVTASGALTAGSLRLLGTGGSHVLINAANAVATLAANTGTVNYAQTGNLSIGTVGATSGIAATGTVLVNVVGNLGLASGATVSAVGSGNALQLVDSGSFTNSAGASALGVSGGGRWLVWSADPAADNRGGLVYGFKQYGATYGATTPADATNNGFLYSVGGTLTASLTGTVSKVYDTTNSATLVAGNYTLSGTRDSDTIVFAKPTAGTYDTIHAGTGKTVTASGLSLTSATNGGATVYGYSLASSTSGAVGTITSATVTAGVTGAVSKVYDSTTAAALVAGNYTLTGVLGSDSVALSHPASGTFDTAIVGAGKTVTVSGLSISGANAGDYVLASTTAAGAIGAVTRATLAAGLAGTVSRIYDTGTTATLGAGNYTLTGILGSDVVTLNNPTAGTYDTADVGTGKTVTVSGLSLSGAGAGNYQLASTGTSAAVGIISAATLTASLTGSVSKIYDTTRAATLAVGNYSLTGVMGSDVVALNNSTAGTYATANVGTAKSVTVNGLSISGAGAGNYQLASTTVSGAVGTVTAATLTAGLTGIVSKVYDTNTAATLAAGNYSLSGVLGSDVVALNNPASGTYGAATVGTALSVTVNGLSLSGSAAGNYQLASTTTAGAVGTITPATLTAGLTGSVAKVYDTTNTAALSVGNYTLTGVLGSDVVALGSPTTGSYDTANVGASKTVTVSGLTISGAAASNYQLASTGISGTVGAITPATLTASLTGTVTRVYDTTNSATLAAGNYTLSGVLGSDVVALNNPAIGSYDTIHAGSGKTVTVTGLAISGAASSNYQLASATTAGAIGAITPATLTTSLIGTVSKSYDTTTAAALAAGNYTLTGALGSDVVALNNPGIGTYDTSHVGAGKTVTVGGLTISGASASDYALNSTTVSGAVGTVTAAGVTVTASLIGTVAKVYDGTNSATLTSGNYSLTGVMGSDAVALNDPTSGTYDTIHVGTGKTVTVTGLAISGTNAGDYTLLSTTTSGAVGTITAATLTAGITGAVSKVYDTTTTATLGAGNYSLTGVIGSDVVAVATTAGTYDTVNVGSAKTVTVTGLAISGANAGDYVLSSTMAAGTVGSITPASLTAGLAGSVAKVYDTGIAATLGAGNYTLGGILGSDVVALNNPAAGTYGTANVGVGKTVTVTGLALSGAGAGNYQLVSTSAAGAVGTITPATLTVGLTGTVSKVYDTTATATLAAGNYNLTGVLGSDVVALNNLAVGSYDTIHAGSSKTVTVSGLSLSGAGAGNYQLAATTTAGAVGTISAATLTAGLTGSVSKTYDTTAAATLVSGNYTLTGVLGSDVVALNDPAAGTYDTIHVGAGKTVTVTGLGLSGANAGDYVLASTSTAGTVGTIAAATLSVALTGVVTKVYDTDTTATLAVGNYTLTGVLGSDVVALGTPTAGAYDTANVGASKTVTANGLTISGADAGDYRLASTTTAGAVGAIASATLTAGLTGTVSKVYDTNTVATLAAGNYTLTGVLGSDVVALSNPATGAYDTANVGAGKTVTVTGLALSGAGAGNYRLGSTVAAGSSGAVTAATLTAGLTGSISKVYDTSSAATLAAGNYTLTGVLGSDVVALNRPTAGTYDTVNVGAGKTVTVSGLALSGAGAGNYQLASTSSAGAVGAITPATLTVGLTGTVSKVYDTTVTATLVAGNYNLTGALGSDVVVLNNPAAGSYDTIHAGSSKTVTVSGLSLSGAGAGNYQLAATTTAGAVGTISAATLTAGLTGSVFKIYDTTNAATLGAGNYTLTGVLGSDVVALNNPATGSFDTIHVGSGKTVTVTGLGLSGANAGDYVLASAAMAANVGTIAAASLTAGLTGTVTKVYDTANSATLVAGNYSLIGVLGGDVVALNNPTVGTYDTANVAAGKTVTVTGLVVSGANAGDYQLASTTTAGAVGAITPATVTAGLTGSIVKVYDTSTAATLGAGNYTLTGVLGSDVVALSNPATGAYDTANVGAGKTVTVTGLALSGAGAGNYRLGSTVAAGSSGAVTAATLTAGLTGSISKVYDTSSAATLAAGNYTLTGVLGSDVVALNKPTAGTYDTIHVGSTKAVTVTGLSIFGAGAGNYQLASTATAGAVGTITPATVTAGLAGAVSKIYDTTTAATIAAGNYTLAGILGSDVVVLNNPTAGTYGTANVGIGKAVTVNGLAISGAGAGDYALASTAVTGAVGAITPVTLSAGFAGTVSKVYDATVIATLGVGNYTLTGILGSDVVALNNPVAGSYDTANAGSLKTVTVTGLSIAGAGAGNYQLAATTMASAIGTVTRATLTAGLVGSVSKVYDTTNAAAIAAGNYTLTGVLGSDAVALNNPVSGTYDTAHAGSGKTVTVNGLTLAGASAGNYQLASTTAAGSVGRVTAAMLTAGLTGAVSKIYDASTAVALAAGNYSLTGVLGSDVVTLNTPAAGTYDTAHVGAAKTVAVTGLALFGLGAGDYQLVSTNVAASIGAITPRTITGSLTGSVSKTYDTTNTATLAAGNYSLSGVMGSDAVTIGGTGLGTYDTAHVGLAKTVSVGGLVLAGASAGDYILASAGISGPVGSIAAATASVSVVGTVSKHYDGTDVATIAPGNYALTGVLGSDAVSLDMPVSGRYSSVYVETGKVVSVTGLGLSGAAAGDYRLAASSVSGTIGTITGPGPVPPVPVVGVRSMPNVGMLAVEIRQLFAQTTATAAVTRTMATPVAGNVVGNADQPGGNEVIDASASPLGTLVLDHGTTLVPMDSDTIVFFEALSPTEVAGSVETLPRAAVIENFLPTDRIGFAGSLFQRLGSPTAEHIEGAIVGRRGRRTGTEIRPIELTVGNIVLMENLVTDIHDMRRVAGSIGIVSGRPEQSAIFMVADGTTAYAATGIYHYAAAASGAHAVESGELTLLGTVQLSVRAEQIIFEPSIGALTNEADARVPGMVHLVD